MSITPDKTITTDKLKELRTRSADLHAIFLDFETAPKNGSASLDVVMDMVRCAYELSSTGDLAMALETSRTTQELKTSYRRQSESLVGISLLEAGGIGSSNRSP